MFVLDSNSQVPLYRQLYGQLREQVLSGALAPHSRLPSVRDLATELSTSRNTVEGAYHELYAEGYLYSRPRSGYFVSELEQGLASLSRTLPVREESPPDGIPCRYDLHPARLHPGSFPTLLWRRCYLESLRECAHQLTHYGEAQGDLALRTLIRQYLERSRGVICQPDQILICAGLQQALEVVAQLLKWSHAALAVENPGYHIPRAVFRNNSFEIVPVSVGPSGLDLEMLRASGSGVVYVTPSHQLPLGHVMPVANRLKLIDWAESAGRAIIEDDYDSELRYHGKPIPSLQGLRPQGNIIYLGTFSKILSPALRLSYLVLPPSLLAHYRTLFQDFACSVSLLEQRTMAKFMEQGHWERHVRRMRIIYQKKHDILLQAVQRHFGDRAAILGQGAGLHVVLQLREENHGEAEILLRARGRGIALYPFSTFQAAGAPAVTTLLLGFGGLKATEIEPAIGLLARLCF